MKRDVAIEARRQAIFDAAVQLIRENGSTDFAMPVLAKRAGLSNATTYNIIGNKATVLYHLLDNCVEDLLTIARQDDQSEVSEDHLLAAADVAIDHFMKDADFYRPLMQHLLGVTDIGTRPSFMSKALRYWRILLEQSGRHASRQSAASGVDLAQIIHIIFIGAMNSWIYGDLNAQGVRAAVKSGITLVLRGAAHLPGDTAPAI